MRTIKDLQTRLIQLKEEVRASLEPIAIEMANSAKTLAERNIKGHGVEGAAYSYSYSRFKAKKGKQAAFVDLTYTNDMWRNVGVVRTVKIEEGKVVALLGGTTPSAADKMGWNEEKYSSFIENNLSNEDKRLLNEIIQRKIRQTIKRILD